MVGAHSTLLMILQRAYPEFDKPGMIVDGPGWLNERRFDIDAKAEGAPTADQYRTMVRLLLVDRFKLKVHTEPRPVEAYSLVVARADGRLGLKLRPASPECLAELDAERARIKAATGPVTFSSGDVGPCKGGTRMNPATGMLRMAGGRTLESLAFALQAYMDKRVIDRTNLPGTYEFDLAFDFMATRSVGTFS